MSWGAIFSVLILASHATYPENVCFFAIAFEQLEQKTFSCCFLCFCCCEKFIAIKLEEIKASWNGKLFRFSVRCLIEKLIELQQHTRNWNLI